MSQACDISFFRGVPALLSEQENRKGWAFPNFRYHPDITALQGHNLTSQIQANPNTVHIMHRIFPVKPFENRPLMLFWNANAFYLL